jgi:hypothetical protein
MGISPSWPIKSRLVNVVPQIAALVWFALPWFRYVTWWIGPFFLYMAVLVAKMPALTNNRTLLPVLKAMI